MAGHRPTERERQVQQWQVYAIAVANMLIELEDPDLWLRAHNLAQDATRAHHRKHRDEAGHGEDGGSHKKPPDEG